MTTRAVIAFRIKPGCEQRARELFSIQNAEVSKRMGLTSNGVYMRDNLVIRIIEHKLNPEELTERLAAGHQQLAKFEEQLNEVLELPRDMMSVEGIAQFQAIVTMEEIFSWRFENETEAVPS
jgi:SchA/CurD like domain-containing protein